MKCKQFSMFVLSQILRIVQMNSMALFKYNCKCSFNGISNEWYFKQWQTLNAQCIYIQYLFCISMWLSLTRFRFCTHLLFFCSMNICFLLAFPWHSSLSWSLTVSKCFEVILKCKMTQSDHVLMSGMLPGGIWSCSKNEQLT